ncbi:MAG: PhoH family protein [Firmicutes bacterium]|jgi:phosphate starvation-inducible PhoH-like protein|nr:PhoH family protein [Bacillota bacterium]
MKDFDKKIKVESLEILHNLFGNLDENIIVIEKEFDVKISSRNSVINIIGDEENVNQVSRLIYDLLKIAEKGETIDLQKIRYGVSLVREKKKEKIQDLNEATILITAGGKALKPKTHGQKIYLNNIKSKDVTFGVGPAGTGKTYLAVAMAVKAFKNKEVSRIVITRPAVEAGESLGFLPGDLQMKVDPYLRPLYDSLYDILGAETYLKYKENGLIEVAPLAYMRGRTLDDSFIILDEAQNTTREQMKMFLTRFGFGSKVVVNGDITQIDLPKGKESGLKHALKVLKDVDEIGVVRLSAKDVVRHSLVKRIIDEYEKYEKKGGLKK